MSMMYSDCPLREGENGDCYNSDCCGGDGITCPYLAIAQNLESKYWQAVLEACELWGKYRKMEGIHNGMQQGMQGGRVPKRVKDTFDRTYHNSWRDFWAAYGKASRDLGQAIAKVNYFGADLTYNPLTVEAFNSYIGKMSNSERARAYKLMRQFVEQPVRYPLTELLERNFQKHQKAL